MAYTFSLLADRQSCAAVAASHAGVEEQKPAAGKRLFTPRCGNCRTCNNLSLKKACETNRARLSENLEPIFHTEEARLAYQAKRAKFE